LSGNMLAAVLARMGPNGQPDKDDSCQPPEL
jgi:hypothetical protein